MDERARTLLAGAATVVIFLLVQLGGLAVVEPFLTSVGRPVEDPSNPANSLLYFLAILLGTGIMLLVIRYDLGWVIRGFMLFGAVVLSWYVLAVFLPVAVATALALALGVGLAAYPEWYVIDAAGVLMGAGAAGLFGITFGVLPALVLLTVLAVYDAISVYGTEHMLTLAEGAMEMRIPVMFVIPTTLSYSFIEATRTAREDRDGEGEGGTDEPTGDGPEGHEDPDAADGEADPGAETPEPDPVAETTDPETTGDPEGPAPGEGGADPDPAETPAPGPVARDALFIGVGDAVIPAVMVTSAVVTFPDAPAVGGPLAVTVPGLASMVGILVGLCGLLWVVFEGRPHAGLPMLNGGAIAGYLVGALASGIPLLEALGLATYL